MAHRKDLMNDSTHKPPLGQRLADSPFLLLAAGLILMFVFYTGWGLYEIMTLPKSMLP